MKKKKIVEFIRKHPDIFESDVYKEKRYLSEEDIPSLVKNENDSKSSSRTKGKFDFKYVLIPAMCCVAVIIVTIVSPLGAVLANSIYQTKTSENNRIVQHGDGVEMQDIQSTAFSQKDVSAEAIVKQYDIPLVINAGLDGDVKFLENEAFYDISISYDYRDGNIKVMNTISKGDAAMSSSVDDDTKDVYAIDIDGVTIYGSSEDGTNYAFAYYETLDVSFYSDSVDENTFKEFLTDCKLIK